MKCFKDLNEKHVKILKEVEKNARNVKQDVYLRDLLKERMIIYDKKYVLTYKGYDHLALAHFKKKGLSRIVDQIDIGKESDIYLGEMNGSLVAVKMYRIGRTSYRKTENRDNIKMDMYKRSMMYCQREYKILRSLTSENIAVPVGCNRHVLITRYYDCKPLVKTRLDDLDYFYNKLMDLVVELYSMGYVHGDFNEYNVLIKEKQIIMVDFPQCIPVTDPRAGEYLRRDVQCVKEYFERKYRYVNERDAVNEIAAGRD
ncbi:atypical/RIO/RIO2 protein kinase [Vavraia culicis subsp. floridensis]|uniref:non-specific serine/threonine protein kinase n=1 Tax=Vavraia culicis (isolate floridensis) TaxID=948595 RepID=L2GUM4_VAVCU|nr:atypical/RIO/RIO2 protein kinase [Vavraia culicis subsp. floridensis]ELA47062.1 atypical/RIO/RIO2 protein kinase [Vavraia culicis subsp. floridensis]